MLHVGLTGGLGSGKSTAAAIFAALGAQVISADEIGRALMQPAEAVYRAIVAAFGPGVVMKGGQLDRPALARLAFGGGRIEELNAIVHPAVIDRQAAIAEAIGARDPQAVIIIESALIFETRYGGEEGWRTRFDKLILVTAPEELKVARFVQRSSSEKVLTEEARTALETEAYRRMARQIPDEQKASLCDYVLTNDGAITELEWQVDRLWPLLVAAAK